MTCLKHNYVALIILLPFTVLSSGPTLQSRFELVTALQKYFSSGCVVWQLLAEEGHDNLLHRNQDIIQLQRFLSRRDVFSTLVDENRLNTTLPCRRNRSLYVLWRSGDIQERHLRQLFSRLDPVGAVWLLLLDSPNASIKDLFQSLYIPFDCEFLVAVESQGAVELTEVYRVDQTCPLETSHWGSWSYRDGLSPPHFRIVARRNDLRGITFYMAAIHDPPIQDVKAIPDGELQVEGFTSEVIRVMSKRLNFSLKIVQADNNRYGMKRLDGTWDGTIGMVLAGKVNMSMTVFTINAARQEDVGFTEPVYNSRLVVHVRKSYEIGSSWKIYISPFSGHLWLCVAVCIAAITFCLVVTQSWTGGEYSAPFSEMALSTLGIFCMQGFALSFGPSSLRIVIWVTFLTAVVLSASYSARIISFLTSRRPKTPFNDLHGLLKEESYGFGMIQSTAELQDFRESTGVRRQLYERKLAPKLKQLPMMNLEGLERACNEKYAFLCNDINVDYNAIDCDMSLFTISTSYEPTAFVIHKKSPFVRLINYTLRQMKISGVARRLRDTAQSVVRNQDQPTFYVEMDHVLFLLHLWMSGVLLSLAALLLEVFVVYRVRARHSGVTYLH